MTTKAAEERTGKKTPTGSAKRYPVIAALFLLIFLLIYSVTVRGDPTGVQITTNITSSAPAVTPGNISSPGGTITIMQLSATQQNANWKAYIGNVSGVLTLQDSAQQTIYQWSMAGTSITGEIYVARNYSVDWLVINCSLQNNIYDEDAFIGLSNASADSINRTFNETTHQAIKVGGRTIGANTCRSLATWVNNTQQAISGALFPEVLLTSNGTFVYVSELRDRVNSYNQNDIVNFQLIVPDDVTTAITMYYFYVEIGA